MESKTAVIIVTHNSSGCIGSCLDSLSGQITAPDQVIVVDSGSAEKEYLEEIEVHPVVSRLIRLENVGFARANNIGTGYVDDAIEYILYLNPDILLAEDCLQYALQVINKDTGSVIITGRLSGYDFAQSMPTGLLDSTGIFRKWYGRWYDRGQGQVDTGQYGSDEYVPAVCGAMMFCRKKALTQNALPGGAVFDEDFFLYKEDIELSMRLRKNGWHLLYSPLLKAYHGRGWHKQRRKMSRKLRIAAAQSEIRLYQKHPSPYFIWALGKYLLVALLDV